MKQRRPKPARKPKVQPVPGFTFAQSIAAVRPVEWATLAVTIGVTIWAWLTYIVELPQDWDSFLLVFVIATVAGGTLQTVLAVYGRASGPLRERLALGGRGWSQAGTWIPLLAPALVFGLTLLVVTPPDTSVDAFDNDMGLYQVLPLLALLTLTFTALGVGAFLLVVLPLGFLLASVLPRDEREPAPADSFEITRPQLAVAGLLLFAIVGFAVSMSSVTAGTAGSTRRSMAEDFLAFITGTGDRTATIATLCFIVVIVVLVIVSNRLERQRMRSVALRGPAERSVRSRS